VGERRTVVEDVLVLPVRAGVALLDAPHEGAVLLPVAQHRLLQAGEVRRGTDLGGVRRGRAGVGHAGWLLWCARASTPSTTRTTPGPDLPAAGTAVPPRLPPPAPGGARHTTTRWGCDGPTPSGSTEERGCRCSRSSGGSPRMTARTPVSPPIPVGAGRPDRLGE